MIVELVAVAGQVIFEVGVAGAFHLHEKVSDKRSAKKKKKAERKGRLKDLEMWENSLTAAISAKAKGIDVPDDAIEYIRLHTLTANTILYTAQRTALRLHVTKNKNNENYNEELANLAIQHVTVKTPATVAKRLSILGDVFRNRTSDEEYREALIRSVVSYSIHKSKVLEPKEVTSSAKVKAVAGKVEEPAASEKN